jgi:hypothetical protein
MDDKNKILEQDLYLDDLLLALVIRTQGNCNQESLDSFLSFWENKKGPLGKPVLDETLAKAKSRFTEGKAHFFICDGAPCKKINFAFPEKKAREIKNCRVSLTECQGPCKQAPVATLRVNDDCQLFAQVLGAQDWNAVLQFVEQATSMGSLLGDPGKSAPYFYDPVHDPEKQDVQLLKFDYLIGHFRGEGKYLDQDLGFKKEVIGSWEVGGRFISLRMSATYFLADGGTDIHKAMVILGFNPETKQYKATAFTDSGSSQPYIIELNDDAMVFKDRPPGKIGPDAKARKILKPNENGFEEILEVDKGNGVFEPFYFVKFQRVESG